MKKLLSILLTTIIITMGLTALQARESSSNLRHNIKRQAVKQLPPFYANKRVKEMCNKWPGCKEWATALFQKNNSLRIVDAEIERWISGWGQRSAVWQHRFYVQTVENGQSKAYLFAQQKEGDHYTYPTPYQIKKFPGHPFQDKPSKHIKYKKESSARTMCMNFTACANWHKQHPYSIVKRAMPTQYIARFDTQGNALWSHDLYVLIQTGLLEDQVFIFHSYQTKFGGPLIHQSSPKKAPYYPYTRGFDNLN